jgi:hypothetical protein
MSAIAVVKQLELDDRQRRFLDTYWSDWEIVHHQDTITKTQRWVIRTSLPISALQRLQIDALFPNQTHKLQV